MTMIRKQENLLYDKYKNRILSDHSFPRGSIMFNNKDEIFIFKNKAHYRYIRFDSFCRAEIDYMFDPFFNAEGESITYHN